ncbi:MAG TPA: hypothetical protein VFB12_12635 [Ktedonobacteraceae bacterium]|nr:hypothetical protein [Ktedonobacteraceae bacterium]
MDRAGQIFRFLSRWGLLIILVLLIIGFTLVKPIMLTGMNFVNILVVAGPVGLISLGMTLVILAGEFDLSAGALAALASLVVTLLIVEDYWPFALALIFILLVVMLFECLVGLLRVRLKVPIIMTTLLAYFLFVYLSPVLSMGVPTYLLYGYNPSVGVIAGVVMLALFLLSYLLTRYSQFGRRLSLVGQSNGVNGGRVKIVVMAISGLLAVAAGIASILYLGATGPYLNGSWTLSALAVLSISGNGVRPGKANVLNTLLGLLILMVLQNGLILLAVDPMVYVQICYVLVFVMVVFAAFFFWRDRWGGKGRRRNM